MVEKSDYLIDKFVSLQPGAPYRLIPFGKLVKNGRVREITPELAAKFKLPHFKPPIKLGSHDESTPAGGFLIGLEVREDGLYGLPEHTEKGAQALLDGSYRYHSPEIIWDGAGYEDPLTGDTIPGPLIVGDALLHTPHLGEAAALYSIEITEEIMSEANQMVSVPMSAWEKLWALLVPKSDPEIEKTAELSGEVEKMEALAAERDQLKAELDALKVGQEKIQRVERFAAELKETKVAEGAELLAQMSDESAAWVIQQFKALSAQIDESALLGENGSAGSGDESDDPKVKLDREVKRFMVENKVDYAAALGMVDRDLVAAAYPVKKG